MQEARLERAGWLETIVRHEIIKVILKVCRNTMKTWNENLKYIHSNWLLYLLSSQW